MNATDIQTATDTIDNQTATPANTSPPLSEKHRRPLRKRVMHVVRRAHLYFGLFMLPWVLLYGITGFLFNHPEAFSDRSRVAFGAEAIRGTPLETLPSPVEQAQEVVDALNAHLKPKTPLKLAPGEVKYGPGMVFARIKTDDQEHTIRYEPKSETGTIEKQKKPSKPEKAPFEVGSSRNNADMMNMMMTMLASEGAGGGKLGLKVTLKDRVKVAAPTICERTGFSTGKVSVFAAPDLIFPLDVDGVIWTAKYNSVTGSVTGTMPGESTRTEMSTRRFLLGLHFSHQYPGEVGVKWYWALFVDAMAFVMCFWSLSGLFMWWQIKATRRWGFVVLLLSSTVATIMGIGMHRFLTM